jgi:hypothetical protein
MKFERKPNKLLQYHKVWVDIGTLEVTSSGTVAAIPCPHVNCTRPATHALRPLIPRWKGFVLQSASPFTVGALPRNPLLLAVIPITIHRHDQLPINFNFKPNFQLTYTPKTSILNFTPHKCLPKPSYQLKRILAAFEQIT